MWQGSGSAIIAHLDKIAYHRQRLSSTNFTFSINKSPREGFKSAGDVGVKDTIKQRAS